MALGNYGWGLNAAGGTFIWGMTMFEIAAGVCLGILMAYFLVRTTIGQLILLGTFFGIAAFLLYLFWDPIKAGIVGLAELVGALLLIALFLRGIQIFINVSKSLFPSPFGTKGNKAAGERNQQVL